MVRSLRDIYDSVCFIKGDLDDGQGVHPYVGQGVFLSPFHVLTSAHVVDAKQGLTFQNVRGQETGLFDGAEIVQDPSLDLALVTLDDPIGHGYSLVPTLRDTPDDERGLIVTRYRGGAPEIDSIIVDRDARPAVHRQYDPRDFVTMRSHGIQLGTGHSGSPVFNQEGRVMSLVSQIAVPNDAMHIWKMSTGTDRVIVPEFTAPKPEALARFIQENFIDADLPEP